MKPQVTLGFNTTCAHVGVVGALQLVVPHAEPGTDAVQALALLGTLTATSDREESPTGEHASS